MSVSKLFEKVNADYPNLPKTFGSANKTWGFLIYQETTYFFQVDYKKDGCTVVTLNDNWMNWMDWGAAQPYDTSGWTDGYKWLILSIGEWFYRVKVRHIVPT